MECSIQDIFIRSGDHCNIWIYVYNTEKQIHTMTLFVRRESWSYFTEHSLFRGRLDVKPEYIEWSVSTAQLIELQKLWEKKNAQVKLSGWLIS